MQNKIISSILLAFVAIFLPLSALAGQPGPEKYVHTRLMSEVQAIEPGQPFWVAFEQAIKPEWHTYWKNPGDSGFATTLTWDLPDGFEAEPMIWPTPERIPFGPLLNYGYSEGVVFPVKITPPATLPSGDVTLSVKGQWLVCRDICIPEEETLTLTLPVANEARPIIPDADGYFKQVREKLPQPVQWAAKFKEQDGKFVIDLDAGSQNQALLSASSVALFPEEWGLYKAVPEVVFSQLDQSQIRFLIERGDRNLSEVENAYFVLSFVDAQGEKKSYRFTATKEVGVIASSDPVVSSVAQSESKENSITLVAALILALLGGLVLNLMPCVFPVLSLKALSLANQADKERAYIRAGGLMYTLGVLLSFALIAGVMIALKAGGDTIGWGFQLQNPLMVGGLAVLLFVIGLNLSGLFEFKGLSFGGKALQGNSLLSSFLTGVLATLVATPCTAPFMGAAMGYALIQPSIIALLIFLTLGFGLAFPYLLLCFVPGFQKILPRPGAWMETAKQFLAFPMYGSTIWLVWVLSQQAGPHGVAAILTIMLLAAFAIWVFAKGYSGKIFALMAVILAIFSFLSLKSENQNIEAKETQGVYSEQALQDALAGDQGVFVNMTASWCITCKINERVAIKTQSIQTLFADQKIVYLVGDWTNRNPEITKFLNSHGRNGVPLYLYYAPKKDGQNSRPEPVVLPQILTPSTIEDVILNN